MVVLVGCGPSVFVPDGAGDGTGTDGDDDDNDDGPGAEDQGDADDESGDDIDACATTPSIRAIRYYAGSALRTVGRDLVRGDDGTLFMAGSMADASNVGLWAAATTQDGDVMWELFGEAEPGGNLRSAPAFEDLAWQQDRLLYAGWAAENGVVGASNQSGNYVATSDPELPGLYAYGIASDTPLTTFVVGRTAQAASIARLDDAVLTWQLTGLSADAITQANDIILLGPDLYVAGQRQDLPWLGRFAAHSAVETLSVVANDGTTFEPEGGELSALALAGDRIVTVGSIRHDKPKPDGSPGSFIYGEPFARAWAPDGTPAWTWQPSATTIRPGSLFAVVTDPNGTAYFAGYDSEFGDEDGPFVGSIDEDGTLVWSLPAEEFGPELEYFHATGLALGEPGQLFVLVSSNRLSEETTAIVEVCY